MTAQPGADELRIRTILKQRGVGPDAQPQPPIPPKPVRERDWLDDILDSPATPEPAPAPVEKTPATVPERPASKPKRQGSKPAKKVKRPSARPKSPRSAGPRTAWDSRPPDPRQSLAEAWDHIPYRLKWLAYHTAAAAAGWRIGLVAWSSNTAAWFAAGHWNTGEAYTLYGLAAVVAGLHRRTRRWAWPAAWLAAIPASSVVLGLLLYGTDYQNLRIPW